MEYFRHISKQVLVVFVLFSWTTDFTNKAEATQNIGSSEDTSPGYFFYQQSEYPRDCQEVLHRCSSSNASGVYVIQPDGYPEPFEVYCQNDDSGWTVIQRRVDGLLSFNRLWKDYKGGFGFPSNNYWIGNDKLSYLTNQGAYELRVDIELSDGSSVYVTYSNFRISDGWGDFSLISLGDFSSGGDWSYTPCPQNMVYGNCACTGTCEEPRGSSGCHTDCALGNEGCFCPAGFLMNGNDCVPQSECPCFWTEVNLIIPNGQSYVNDDCTQRRFCESNQLVQEGDYQCDTNAQCTVRDGVRQCICNEPYEGDGQNCEAPAVFKDCYDVYDADSNSPDGIYTVQPTGWPGSPFDVYCEMSNGGGWTVFQRRSNSDRTSFYRNWEDYREGFGSLTGSHWLGNDKLHYLTRQRNYKLRVDIVTSGNSAKYAEYTSFTTANETNKYRLAVSGYSGNAGNGMHSNNGKDFSTFDRDNDDCGRHNCAAKHRGGWWYWDGPCSGGAYSRCYNFNYGSGSLANTLCTYSNLNGDYNGGNGQNIFWAPAARYCNLNSAEIKIRPSI